MAKFGTIPSRWLRLHPHASLEALFWLKVHDLLFLWGHEDMDKVPDAEVQRAIARALEMRTKKGDDDELA